MKKSEQNYLILKLPSDYYYKLVDIAINEFHIASKKWKVNISKEDKESILDYSREQLVKKIEDVTYFPFSLYDEEVKIRIIDEREELSKKEKDALVKNHHIATVDSESIDNKVFADVSIVFNASHGYSFVDFETRKSVLTKDFYEHFMSSMEKWLRTAVFYGVASYAD